MAQFGAGIIAEAGAATSVESGDINVTGTDVCLVLAGGCESASAPQEITLTWDPAGNAEAPTGDFATEAGVGGFTDARLAYLDDPTPANAGVEASTPLTCDALIAAAMFCTNAGDVVGTDADSNSYTSGTEMSVTVPNAVAGDVIADFCFYDPQGDPGTAATVGADQTNRGDSGASTVYSRGAISTQDGADGGVMSWTVPTIRYTGALLAGRIPDAGGGPAGAIRPINRLQTVQYKVFLGS